MLLKAADDKTNDVRALEALLTHPAATSNICQLVEREIRNIRSGVKGEAETAYELGFNFQNRNWVVIHDLRLEHAGRVAQLDHLLINRLMEMYVCESKRFSEGVAINDSGEFSAFFGHRPYGIASPIEQNRRHVLVLEDLFKSDAVQLPRRLGFKIKPDIKSFVLVSKTARISRPKREIPGLDTVIKTDQFVSRLERDSAKDNNPLGLAKIVGPDTLEAFGRQLVGLHKPIQFDWAAKFGLAGAAAPTNPSLEPAQAPLLTPSPTAATAEPAPKSKLVCYDCNSLVSYAVAKFCWGSRRFGGKVFCMDCQKKV
jgi:hypothetical protein